MPPSVGAFASQDRERGAHRGVVYALAASPLDRDRIWAGTDDGLVHVTRDHGRTWTDVTPPALTPWSKISVLEASHFDANEAWAAVNRWRLDDLAPHIWRTRDGGRTWDEVVNGLPADVVVNAVREDPAVRGLLYAATERGVFASLDDGGLWQPIGGGLPPSSVRDLVVHGTDLAVATHGRSFWILDDVSPLRQQAQALAAHDAYLVRPALATRVRGNRNTDTPVPPDEPAGQNPPEGVAIDWYLPHAPRGPVTIDVLDRTGRLVRHVASTDLVREPATRGETPGYWMRREVPISGAAGAQRWWWDLRETAPPARERSWGMSAIAHDTPSDPRGPWVVPGTYTVRLGVDGQTFEQPLVVRMDPRVPVSTADLETQHALSLRLLAVWRADSAAADRVHARRAALTGTDAATDSLRRDLTALEGRSSGPWWARGGGGKDFAALASDCQRALDTIQRSDSAPTPALAEAVPAAERALAALLERERVLTTRAASSR